jgi:hypothetical protein
MIGLSLVFGDEHGPNGTWYIADGPPYLKSKVIWSRQRTEDEDTGEYSWPEDMRKEYERLLGRPEFVEIPEEQEPNLVELVADDDGCAWDQKCCFGHRVESHAVYCHNDKWLYAPRKCKRGEWLADFYGGDPADYAHEKCPGFKANPLYKRDEQ